MYLGKINRYSAALSLLVSINSTAVFAGAMGDVRSHFKGHFLAQLGGYSAVQGTAQYIRIREDLVGNDYTVRARNQGSALAGVGYLLDGPTVFNRFSLAYGLNAFFLGQTTTNGYIVEEKRVTNLSYSYRTQHIPLYFALKSLIDTKSEQWKLTVDGGVGVNFMSLSHYREAPLTTYTVVDDAFSDSNPTPFSATVGVGLRFSKTPAQLPVECGYRFFYLGQGRFNINNYQAIDAVKTGSSYANALVCSVSI